VEGIAHPGKHMDEKRSVPVSKIELAKTLKAIRDIVASDKEYQRIKEILAPQESEAAIEKAIRGLSEEDEFALMCRLMGTATHLVRLEQRPLIPGDYIAPDFLARFQPGCSIHGFGSEHSSGFKCLIEVKSTHKDEFKLSGSLLRRRRNFADMFGLPLLFAIRFVRFEQNALWIMVEDSERESASLRVTYQDLVDGVRHVLWDEYWYFLRPGVYFKGVFDASYNGDGVRHPEYGTQREFQIIVDDQVISLTDTDAFIYGMFFEAFGLKEIKVERQGSITYQVLAPQLATCSIADMIYSLNRLPRDEKGQVVYDPSRILARLDLKSNRTLVTRHFTDRVAQSLFNAGSLYKIGVGGEEAHLEKWHEYGGQK